MLANTSQFEEEFSILHDSNTNFYTNALSQKNIQQKELLQECPLDTSPWKKNLYGGLSKLNKVWFMWTKEMFGIMCYRGND